MTYPFDDLTNHAVPVAAGVHDSVAVVLHQVQFVLEAQLLGELRDQVDAVALQLRAFAHGVRVLLRKQNIQPHFNAECEGSLWENRAEAAVKVIQCFEDEEGLYFKNKRMSEA